MAAVVGAAVAEYHLANLPPVLWIMVPVADAKVPGNKVEVPSVSVFEPIFNGPAPAKDNEPETVAFPPMIKLPTLRTIPVKLEFEQLKLLILERIFPKVSTLNTPVPDTFCWTVPCNVKVLLMADVNIPLLIKFPVSAKLLAVDVLAVLLNSLPLLIVNEVANNVVPLILTILLPEFPFATTLPKFVELVIPKPLVWVEAGAVIVINPLFPSVLIPSPKRSTLFVHAVVNAVLLNDNAEPTKGGSTMVIVPPVTVWTPVKLAIIVPNGTLVKAELLFPSILKFPLSILKAAPPWIKFPFKLQVPALMLKVPKLFKVAIPPPIGPILIVPAFKVSVAPDWLIIPNPKTFELFMLRVETPTNTVPKFINWPAMLKLLLLAIKVPPLLIVKLLHKLLVAEPTTTVYGGGIWTLSAAVGTLPALQVVALFQSPLLIATKLPPILLVPWTPP